MAIAMFISVAIVCTGIGYVIGIETTPKTIIEVKTWLGKVAGPYRDTTIRVLTESVPPNMVIEKTIPDFEAETGINVEYELTYYDDVYGKAVADFAAGTGIYDIVYTETEWRAAWADAGYLYPISDLMEEYPELIEFDLDLEDLLGLEHHYYGGKLYSLPHEIFGMVYYYRTDLFEEYSDEFEAEYGRSLEVPETLDEYIDIAKFFTEKVPGVYGHLAQAKTHNAGVCDWQQYHQMFVGVPGTPSAAYYNSETMRAEGVVNSPKAVEALQTYIDLLQYAPPGALTYTWDEAAAAMQQGIIAQGPLWGDWCMAMWDPDASTVVGKIGFSVIPYHENPNEYRHNGGGVSGWGINADSKNKEAAWLFAQWTKRKEYVTKWTIEGGVVIRESSLADPIIITADKYYGGYFSAQIKATPLSFPPIMIPEFTEMKTVAEEPIGMAVSGQITPKEGLDWLAELWDEILATAYP